jgi:hypothetical protein
MNSPTDLANGATGEEGITAGIAKFPDNCRITKLHVTKPRNFYKFVRVVSFKLNGVQCTSTASAYYPWDPNNPPLPPTTVPLGGTVPPTTLPTLPTTPPRTTPPTSPTTPPRTTLPTLPTTPPRTTLPTTPPRTTPPTLPTAPPAHSTCNEDSIGIVITEGVFNPGKYLQRTYTAAVDGVDGAIAYTWNVTPSVTVAKDPDSPNNVLITFPKAATPVKDIKYKIKCTIKYMQDGVSCTTSSEYTTTIQHTVYDSSRICNSVSLTITEYDSTTYDFAEGGPPISDAYLHRKYIANIDSPFIDFMGATSYEWSVKRSTALAKNTAKIPDSSTSSSQYTVKYIKPNVAYTAPKNKEIYTVTCKATINFGIVPMGISKECKLTATHTTTIAYEKETKREEPDPPVNIQRVTSILKEKAVLQLDTIPITLIEFLRQMKTGGTQMRDVIKRDIQTYDAKNGDALILDPNLSEAQQNKVLDKILKAQPIGALINKYIVYAAAWKAVPVLATTEITKNVLKYSGSSYDVNGKLLSSPNSYDTDNLRPIFIELFNQIWISFQANRSGGDNKALLRHLMYDMFRAMVLQYTIGGGSVADRAASFATEFKFCIGDIPLYNTQNKDNGITSEKLHWTKAAATKDLTFSNPPDPNGKKETLIRRDKDKLSTFLGMKDFSALLIAYATDPDSDPKYPGEG